MPSKCKMYPSLYCPVLNCECAACTRKRQTTHRVRDARRAIQGGGSRGRKPMKLVRKELMKRPAGQITYAMKSNAGISYQKVNCIL